MNMKDFGKYLIIPTRTYEPGYLDEMKRLEWIFIIIRWLWVPVVFIMAWLHQPAETALMYYIGGSLNLVNAAATLLNLMIKTPRAQHVLGFYSLAIDMLFAWSIIFVFARDFYTAAYAIFVYVIIEAAIRQGLAGSIGMVLIFIGGLYGVFQYRDAAFGVRFSVSGYAFWCTLMSIVGIAIGMIIHEAKRRRRQSERYLRVNALLTERQRIARDLHDTVLKTLQGLSLEAHALSARSELIEADIRDTARYMEEVCNRTSREIREVILDLRQDDISAGIRTILQKEAETWSRTTGIPYDFSMSGFDTFTQPEMTRQLANILTEALDNVRRHSGASSVRLSLAVGNNTLKLEIADNGHGFEPDAKHPEELVASGHLGIAGMKERAGILNGNCLVKSSPGGVTVMVEIPLARSRSALL